MRIESVHLTNFKRFSDLSITGLPETARLVVLVGPNGCGKSSLFDAFLVWHTRYGYNSYDANDPIYYPKAGVPFINWELIFPQIAFHQPLPDDFEDRRRFFYFRSAYRNTPDLSFSGLDTDGRQQSRPRVQRMSYQDASVAENYQQLVVNSVEALYDGRFDDVSVRELREELISQVRESMRRVFGDLVLTGPGNPLRGGTFYFEKGVSKDFHYKNLSGGEKAAFDLLLDLVVKRRDHISTVYCIDEPESHTNTRVQAPLLREMVNLLPDGCQLWISTHAIGMMREAKSMQAANPDDVVFLDFFDKDFDQPVVLTPARADRRLWANALDVALADLAGLVAPSRVVLCEGRPAGDNPASKDKAELDAQCYRAIFGGEYPDTDFISVGNEQEVRRDTVGIGRTIQTLTPGIAVSRVVDQDDRSPQEIADLKRAGVRVLSKRHLEAYLMDDEILTRLCEATGQPGKIPEVLAAKQSAMRGVVAQGKPSDDVKSARGAIYVDLKRILSLSQAGNTADAFLRDTLAPLVSPDTGTYARLRRDIFDE